MGAESETYSGGGHAFGDGSAFRETDPPDRLKARGALSAGESVMSRSETANETGGGEGDYPGGGPGGGFGDGDGEIGVRDRYAIGFPPP